MGFSRGVPGLSPAAAEFPQDKVSQAASGAKVKRAVRNGAPAAGAEWQNVKNRSKRLFNQLVARQDLTLFRFSFMTIRSHLGSALMNPSAAESSWLSALQGRQLTVARCGFVHFLPPAGEIRFSLAAS